MPDTVRTLAALQTLLADNASGDISAQDVRDFLVSVFPPEPQVARVETSESTASDAYTDLATSGPAVTVTVGASGLLIVVVSTYIISDTGNRGGTMAFAVSGANTIAAGAETGVSSGSNAATAPSRGSRLVVLTGLNAGATTVTAKYAREGSGNATFRGREIAAIAWGGDF